MADFFSVLQAVNPELFLITETWLQENSKTAFDLLMDDEFPNLYKKIHMTRSNRRGGGVSIIIKKEKISVKDFKILDDCESVLISLRIKNIHCNICVCCVYLPPDLNKAEVDSRLDKVVAAIYNLIISNEDNLLILGGDWNEHNLDSLSQAFDEIVEVQHGPTHLSGKKLDGFFLSKKYNVFVNILPALKPDNPMNSKSSDHKIVHVDLKIPKPKNNNFTSYKVRSFTDKNRKKFAKTLEDLNTSFLIETIPNVKPFDLFKDTFIKTFEECFPLRDVTVFNPSKPWRDKTQIANLKKLASIGRKNGCSDKWRKMQRSVDAREKWLVQRYGTRVLEKLKITNPKKYWGEIKALVGMEREDFTVFDIFPDCTDRKKVLNETASFFSNISNRHPEVETRFQLTSFPAPIITPFLFKKEIKKNENKKSSLRNDIPIGILKENINTLAGPLADLYNEIFHLGEYPKEWKIETTIIIPKKNNPKNVSETRNISITPALSKLCERILLTFLENQILSKISHFQFGGRKGTGISDLIAILLDKISGKIDQGGVAIFTSIDFSKAFNNIDHNKLLDDLVALGAEGWLIRVLESYLAEE
jgi:hypothetical protein